ncbi:Cytochrome bo(3) ubiquinol oxidase subunit 3 [Sulfitobacter sp. THAF37]|uniref:cytochrome c oxidase subunit 3 n=1 Tax=Sulfitobacter sp. THAF37 TaxID=2587855 RepID=UPI0012680EDD|nr:cytochrome c oxidase subunit 3 [Sulfitobacter sp. THAF37]QFT59376.1 Cytochrome bo(3) ubiquinol oxidase subunit 3 [Sulfitobacter sp. THAF37]
MTTSNLHPGPNLGDHHGEAHYGAEAIVFGFWVFLMSDLVIFGLVFASYLTVANQMGMAGGPGPAEAFDLRSVFVQTMILLTSSLTFGFATLAMRCNHGRAAIARWLAVSLLLGIGFLTLELRDFAHMIDVGAVPQRSGFWSAFWGLVPLHGVHVASGCLWIGVMLAQMAVLGMIPAVKTRILRLGLFWHFLDLIWVAIFSIVYLGGLMP